MFTLDYPVTVSCEENSFTLAHCLWLYDKSFCSFVIKLFLKAFRVSRQNPGFGEKIEMVGHGFLHHV
jgi:hypothetical protein